MHLLEGILLQQSKLTNSSLLLLSRSVISNSLRPHGPQQTRLPCPSLSGVSVSCSVVPDSLRPSGLQPTRPLSMRFSRQGYWSGWPFPSHCLWSLLKFMSSESVMLSNHLILCCPFLFLPSIFPSI